MFFSEYAEGSSNNKYLEIFNGTNDVVNLNEYAYPSVINDPSTPGEYEYWYSFESGATIEPGEVYIVAHPSADDEIKNKANEFHTFLSNGDDAFALVRGTEENYEIIDIIGDWQGDPGSGWDVAGVTEATKNHTLVRKSSVTQGNGGDWDASRGTNADDSEWIVYPINTWTYLGSHVMEQPVEPTVINYVSASTSGDPHIFPLHGNMYELPQTPGIYRLLQGKNMYINASTREISKKEKSEMHTYFRNHGVTKKMRTSLIDNGVFYKNVFVYCDGHSFDFDFDTKQMCFKDKKSTLFFKFETSQVKGGVNMNKYEQSTYINQCNVSFSHPAYGLMSIQLNYFSNPQIKYGLGIKFPKNTKGLDGLLIREYIVETMTIQKINDKTDMVGVLGNNVVNSKMILMKV